MIPTKSPALTRLSRDLPIEGLDVSPRSELYAAHAPFLIFAMDPTQIGLKVWELLLQRLPERFQMSQEVRNTIGT